MKDVVIINEKDNVGINLIGNDVIPAGHKFALRNISKGETIIKYGQVIGRATCDIKEGEFYRFGDNKTERGKKLRSVIAEKLGFASLEFQSLDGVIKAIGLDECELCTYCWNGKE